MRKQIKVNTQRDLFIKVLREWEDLSFIVNKEYMSHPNRKNIKTKNQYVNLINQFDYLPISLDKETLKDKLIDESFIDYDEYYTDGGQCLISLQDVFKVLDKYIK